MLFSGPRLKPPPTPRRGGRGTGSWRPLSSSVPPCWLGGVRRRVCGRGRCVRCCLCWPVGLLVARWFVLPVLVVVVRGVGSVFALCAVSLAPGLASCGSRLSGCLGFWLSGFAFLVVVGAPCVVCGVGGFVPVVVVVLFRGRSFPVLVLVFSLVLVFALVVVRPASASVSSVSGVSGVSRSSGVVFVVSPAGVCVPRSVRSGRRVSGAALVAACRARVFWVRVGGLCPSAVSGWLASLRAARRSARLGSPAVSRCLPAVRPVVPAPVLVGAPVVAWGAGAFGGGVPASGVRSWLASLRAVRRSARLGSSAVSRPLVGVACPVWRCWSLPSRSVGAGRLSLVSPAGSFVRRAVAVVFARLFPLGRSWVRFGRSWVRFSSARRLASLGLCSCGFLRVPFWGLVLAASLVRRSGRSGGFPGGGGGGGAPLPSSSRSLVGSRLFLSSSLFLRPVAAGRCPVSVCLSAFGGWPVRSAVLLSLCRVLSSFRVWSALWPSPAFRRARLACLRAGWRALGLPALRGLAGSGGVSPAVWWRVCRFVPVVPSGLVPSFFVVGVSSRAVVSALSSLARCLRWLVSRSSALVPCPPALVPALSALVRALACAPAGLPPLRG